MKYGLKRFEFYLDQLQVLLTKAAKQKNPGLWLYQNNARTPLFMLEGLAKLYSGIHNRKKFEKIKAQFKVLEDILGSIDYYDTCAKSFATNKKMPASITAYLQAQTREKIQSLNEILTEKEWLGSASTRIKKIKEKLDSADWLKEKKEVEELNEFYGAAIYDIVEFVQAQKFTFDNVEADVHELRRKLRWLSIYPQALRGVVQLSNTKSKEKALAKYQTTAIISSPFNKLPDAGEVKHFLLLNKQYFYALSWMIAELGKLKDSGLSVIAIKEALQQTKPISDTEAYTKAYQYLGNSQTKLPQILKDAASICKTYFNEHNLEHLVIGTAAAE
jgi:HPt (histidine-containing phosphotransfer) domain-containing protein